MLLRKKCKQSYRKIIPISGIKTIFYKTVHLGLFQQMNRSSSDKYSMSF